MANKVNGVLTLAPDRRKSLYDMIGELHGVRQRLAVDVVREKQLREAIVDQFFPDAGEGTTSMDLEFGKQLKVVIPLNRTVDEIHLAAVRANAMNTEDSALIAACDAAFKYKPSLSVEKWKELTPETRLKLADVVTEKRGLPAIEIATPKK